MSWMAKLYDTYEQALNLELHGEKSLIPMWHSPQNAHINIVLDGEGQFLYASVLEKTQINLPATEKSAGRSNGESPHALADKIQYVAMDYANYGGVKPPYFAGYQEQLKNWCESPFSHPKAKAIHFYVAKGTLVKDLIDADIIHVDAGQRLLTSWPQDNIEENPPPPLFKVLPKDKGKIDQSSALVCWTVQIPGDREPKTWLDKSLQDSWILYSSSEQAQEGLCYVTGKYRGLATSHPAKLRHSGDKAKLVSSNDTSGYTFRGRFVDSTQANGVSIEVTQKAHSALRWLIERQGYRNGDQVIVAWAISGKPVPAPMEDTYAFMSEHSEESNIPIEVEQYAQLDSDLGELYAKRLNKKIAGYRAQLGDAETIIIMAIDSATPGRMGITYYREYMPKEFLDNLESWHQNFSWQQRHTRKINHPNGKKPKIEVIWPISAPSPKSIAEAVYGKTLTDSLKKNFYERILPCIVEQKPFPIDILNGSIRSACNPLNCEKWEWERNLGIACALYRGFHIRHPKVTQRRVYSMSLDRNSKSRDYLYGRLLAVAERIEQVALSVGNEKRLTTAERFMQRFADRPYSTWRNIELALKPYMQRLQNNRTGFLVNQQKELDSIMCQFQESEFANDRKLSGEFLLAYHCQRQELQNKNPTETIH